MMGFFDKKTETIIKIDEDDLNDAKASSADFSNLTTKKRAFINVLGARLAMKTLFSQKIKATNMYSMYTINNVLEQMDIADIYYNDVKIDVRLVFNENEIFIPRSHFNNDILPDVYLVLVLKPDFSSAEMLGFFTPDAIDKNNSNREFYFFESENLSKPNDLKKFLDKYDKAPETPLSQEDLEYAKTFFVPSVDGEIKEKNRVFLLQQLSKSIELRGIFVEFENFEFLSSRVAREEMLLKDGVLDVIAGQRFADEDESEVEEEIVPFSAPEEIATVPSPNNGGDFASAMAEGALVGGGIALAGGAIAAGMAATAQAQTVSAITAGVDTAIDTTIKAVGTAGEVIEKISEEIVKSEPIQEEIEDNSFNFKIVDDLSDELSFDEEDDNLYTLTENTDDVEAFEFEDDEEIEIESMEEETVENEQETEEDSDLFELDDLTEDLNDSVELDNFEETVVLNEIEEQSIDDGEILNQVQADVTLEETEELNSSTEEDSDLFELDDLTDIEEFVETEDDTEMFEFEDEILTSFDDMETVEEIELTDSTDVEESAEINDNVETFEDLAVLPTLDTLEALPELVDLEEAVVLEETEVETMNEEQETIEETEELNSSPSNLLTSSTEEETEVAEDLSADDFMQELADEEIEETNSSEDSSLNINDEEIESFSSQIDDLFNTLENASEIDDLTSEAQKLLGDSIQEEKTPLKMETEETQLNPEADNEPQLEKDFDIEDEENKFLQDLFKNKTANNDLNLEFKESGLKLSNKKTLIAASVAGAVLVSIVAGTLIFNGQKQEVDFPKDMNTPPVSADAASQVPVTSTDSSISSDIVNTPMTIDNNQAPAIGGARDMGKAVSDAFMSEPITASVSKVSWEVPEEVAYNDAYRRYLQTAGKNLKLSLQNDLLLSTEMAYSNKVVIDITIGSGGTLQSSNISVSSGSKQIDGIVLQSVKETLQYLKAPSSELGGQSVDETLIINF